MPELPEVETVARSLRQLLVGRTIVSASVDWPRSVARPAVEEFRLKVAGRMAVSVDRRGKYVVVALDRGYLLVHLKMSGRLWVVRGDDPPDKHTHVIFYLDDGQELRFHDTRKFGRVYLVDDPEEVTAHLGPEPLADDFCLDGLRRLLEQRKGRLKSLLLNQQFLAGLGNIYADEVLFAARLHPLRRADSLSPEEQARLYEAIRTVLRQAVAAQGTTLDDGGYTDAHGQAGAYQAQLGVYDRKGQPCPRCQTPIERIVVVARSTYFCPHCQAL